MNKKNRVTLDLGPAATSRLHFLENLLESSKIGVFKKALELLDRVADAERTGHKLLLEDQQGNQRELMILGLSPPRENPEVDADSVTPAAHPAVSPAVAG